MKNDKETLSITPSEISFEEKNNAVKTKKRKINNDIPIDDCYSNQQNNEDNTEQRKSKKKKEKNKENMDLDADQELPTNGIIGELEESH